MSNYHIAQQATALHKSMKKILDFAKKELPESMLFIASFTQDELQGSGCYNLLSSNVDEPTELFTAVRELIEAAEPSFRGTMQ